MTNLVVDGSVVTWKGKGRQNIRGTTTMPRLGLGCFGEFPREFSIRSHRTGTMRKFTQDHETNEQNEFYDGEAMSYISGDGVRVCVWTSE